jgi:glycerophosphoryl diester phosphodiesterase
VRKLKNWRGRILLGVFASGLILVIFFHITSRPAQSFSFYSSFTNYPLIIAHRGGDELWPGDTLYAFQQAAKLKVDLLEMDIHASVDGVLVVNHDETVDRTTNGSGKIKDLSLAQLKELDAGYRWTMDNGLTYPFRGKGVNFSTLEEVFKALPGYKMNIEIKQATPSIVQPFCSLIRKYGKMNQVLVASFDDQVIKEFRNDCPEVATSASQSEVVSLVLLNYIFLSGTYSPVETAMQVPEEQFGIPVTTSSFIASAHNRGLKVYIWTINTEENIKKFIDMGVDGVITDRPDIALKLVGR